MRQQHDGDCIHRVDESRSEYCDNGDREQQTRQGEHDVHHPHDHGLRHAAKESRDETEHDAEPERNRHRDHANQQRQSRAVDQAREHVSSDGIGAEQKSRRAICIPRRGCQREFAVLLVRRMGTDDIGEDRQQHQQRNERETDQRAAIACISAPEFAEASRRRAGRDRRTRELSHGECAG